MNVVYASDDKYSMIAGVSIESLYVSNREVTELQVYILASNITKDNKAKLETIAHQHNRSIHFVDVQDSSFGEIDVQRWSVAAFARLYTPSLLSDLHRILYLDCDVMVNEELLPLWETDIGEYSCAAVAEPFSSGHKKNIGQCASDVYYNSGVMLINLEKWREINAEQIFKDCIIKHNGHVPYVDQGVINEVFNRNIYRLSAKYNVFTEYYEFSYKEVETYRADKIVYSQDEINDAIQAPAIVHFVSSFLTARPWIEGSNHPYTKQWLLYKQATPWQEAPLWQNLLGKEKLALGWIVNHMPRSMGIWVARIVNSRIRPLIDK